MHRVETKYVAILGVSEVKPRPRVVVEKSVVNDGELRSGRVDDSKHVSHLRPHDCDFDATSVGRSNNLRFSDGPYRGCAVTGESSGHQVHLTAPKVGQRGSSQRPDARHARTVGVVRGDNLRGRDASLGFWELSEDEIRGRLVLTISHP